MNRKTKLAVAFAASAILSPLGFAAGNPAGNPFALTSLTSGYQLAQADEVKVKDGKCGEAKCGADKKMDKKSDGKAGEAKCGADKK